MQVPDTLRSPGRAPAHRSVALAFSSPRRRNAGARAALAAAAGAAACTFGAMVSLSESPLTCRQQSNANASLWSLSRRFCGISPAAEQHSVPSPPGATFLAGGMDPAARRLAAAATTISPNTFNLVDATSQRGFRGHLRHAPLGAGSTGAASAASASTEATGQLARAGAALSSMRSAAAAEGIALLLPSGGVRSGGGAGHVKARSAAAAAPCQS